MSGTPFYIRVCEMNIGGRSLSYPPFTLEFEISFAVNSVSRVKAKIYNPSVETIQACEKKQNGYAPIIITAGYASDFGTCVTGEIVKHEEKKSGSDNVLELVVSDAAWKWQHAKVNKSWSGKITAENAIYEILNEVGITPAKVELAENKTYERGLSLVGMPLSTVMHNLAKDTKSEFFFRNGQAGFVSPARGYGQAFVLTPASGLLDANLTDYGAKIKMLFQYKCGPASLLILKNNEAEINFKVRSGKHQFSPTGNAITEVEAVRL